MHSDIIYQVGASEQIGTEFHSKRNTEQENKIMNIPKKETDALLFYLS